MQLPQNLLQKSKVVLHGIQGLVVFLAWAITIAVFTKPGSTDGRTKFYFALCWFCIPLLIYQVAVPQFNRTKRFSNAYAHVAIDALLAIFWFAATISVATWTNAGIKNGVARPGYKGCDAFLYGDGKSRGSNLLCLATTFISVKNLLFYRRNGFLPGITTASDTGAHPLPHHHSNDDDDDQAKYAFSSNPNDHFDEDEDDHHPTAGPSRNTNYEVLHPAPDDHDTGLHPASSRPWNQNHAAASSTNLGLYNDEDTSYHSSSLPPPQLPPHRDPFRDRSPSPYRVQNLPTPPVEIEDGDTSYHGRYERPQAGDPSADEAARGGGQGGRVDCPHRDYHR
ncbi:MAG: hypothetical protein LQ346_001884 [Caloplaca aetnensis]|nr:MAG: hypothetical protein LQ346_001884 [Caloplaca aetnensis]